MFKSIIFKMQKQGTQLMESFVDKLCDHLPGQRIKLLIDNGFDEWETISFLKGQELVELGFDTQECIIIMVAANSNCKEAGLPEIFSETAMQSTISLAKEHDRIREEAALKEEELLKQQRQEEEEEKQGGGGEGKAFESSKSIKSSHVIKQWPKKQLSEALLVKGTSMKTKPGEKVNLSKVTMISLEEKEITHLANLEKVPNIVNLHLGNNYIYKLEGLLALSKVRVLKLEHNNLAKIEGLEGMQELQRLFLSNNYISRLQNLTRQPRLRELYISRQKTDNFTFDAETTSALSYTLEKLECNHSKVRNITELKHLTVVREVYLSNNQLEDIGELSETISSMEGLRILSFKDNPLAKAQKYRDYIVILSKTLEELDGKKILAKEREYLVKLYALKHAKQNKGEQVPKSRERNSMEMQGVKLEEEGYSQTNINRATDLRGIGPHANTKHVRR